MLLKHTSILSFIKIKELQWTEDIGQSGTAIAVGTGAGSTGKSHVLAQQFIIQSLS